MGDMSFISAARAAGQQVLQPDFDRIEAAGLPDMGRHWCVWRLQSAEGRKPKKVPYDGRRAINSQIPEDWIPYEDAKRTYLLSGDWDGIGYLPSEEDAIVALDADGVLGLDGTVGESGQAIVEAFERIGCHLEVSPSGTGLRGFISGVKDGKAKTTIAGHSVEAYQPGEGERAQYVTVTGRAWGEIKPFVVPDGQTRLEEFLVWSGLLGADEDEDEDEDEGGRRVKAAADLDGWERRSDEAIERMLLGSLNLRGKINRLWCGDASDYAGDSEARAALLNQLGYITRDADQIERIIRRSKLSAERFDEKRRGYGTFIAYEIQRALERQDRNYDLDRAEKQGQTQRKAAAAQALKERAAECTGGLGIADLLDDKGRLHRTMHAASQLLIRDARLAGTLFYDEFSMMPIKTISFAQAFGDPCAPKTNGRLEDDDFLAVSAWLQTQWNLTVEDQPAVFGAVRRWARATSINPVTTRLRQLANEWDGVERLGAWLTTYMGAKNEDEDEAYYLSQIGRRFLIAVVARAFVPGVQQDQMLVLEDPIGGEGKTAAVRVLGRAIDESAFLEGFSPTDSKDCFLLMRGKILGEWGELQGFDRRESEWVKGFITRKKDDYRDPYGTMTQSWPRTISFVATTNSDDYLKDASGRRRYWPVRCGRIDLLALERDAPMLWAEAVRAYQAGERFWLDKNDPADARLRALCDREQKSRLLTTSYDDLARGLADRIMHGTVLVPDLDIKAAEWMIFSVGQMRRMLSPAEPLSHGEWQLASAALKRCGWSNGREFRLPNGNSGWALRPETREELRRLHELGGPPTPTEGVMKALRQAQRKEAAGQTAS